ncbi:hypothetical protein F52700_1288 [Fusarium sp. NRRL 52700]|nr:hypothetical protein F52700_1288 [Fusarium sp. NRRL 52700]
MALMPPTSRREKGVQQPTPEEYDCTNIEELGVTHSLQLSAPHRGSGTIDPCQLESDPILTPGPGLELMPEAYLDYALQTGVYSWEIRHATCQAAEPSMSMFNAPTAAHLGFHDAMEDLYVTELQGDCHLQIRESLSPAGPLPLCSFNSAMKTLGRLTPRVQALSSKSQEVLENWGSFQEQGDIDRRLPTLLLNDAVFKLVMAWLFNPSEHMDDECSILNSLWTAKNEFSNEDVVVELLSCSSIFTTTTQSLQVEIGSRNNKVVYSNNVASHLVVACHALLLESFGAVLSTLQYVADAAKGTIAPGFADLRLAMVVQLCSYLFVRQCRVVDNFLEALSGPNLTAESPNKGSQDERVIQELKARVDSRMAWFQTLWYSST